jgi:hypothetical protein
MGYNPAETLERLGIEADMDATPSSDRRAGGDVQRGEAASWQRKTESDTMFALLAVVN